MTSLTRSLARSVVLGFVGLAAVTAAAAEMPSGSGMRDINGACNSMRGVFASHRYSDTTVTLVKVFEKGDTLALADTPSTPAPLVATSDLCLVKLIVGPGNPGPAGAPSTSKGIGIEIWLPSSANWTGRIHVLAEGGWSGDPRISSTTDLFGDDPATWAMNGDVGAISDNGHAGAPGLSVFEGSFAFNPDGTVNTTLLRDLSSRSIHETAVKTKIITHAFYREPAKYAYLDGCSSGGRQAYKAAQVYPDDYNGILAGAPSINQSQFFPALLYPQIVMLQDLAGVYLTQGQLDLAAGAAVSACDAQLNGMHDGFISDPETCRYDVRTDAAVLCVANGGSNTTNSCLTTAQANAVNKIWYGDTANGTAPPPSVDNGQQVFRSAMQRWWGIARGDEVGTATSTTGTEIWAAQVALNLQDVSYAGPGFVNASTDVRGRWTELDYGAFEEMLDRGLELNDTLFANIDTNDPDLTLFRDSGGKFLTYQGLADPLVPPSDTKNYYTRVSNLLGDFARTQNFYRLFFVPGMGHCVGNGTVNGIPGVSPPANPPLITFDAGGQSPQMYDALVDWVEQGEAPTTITVTNSNGTISRPLCMYPAKQTYIGGDVNAAASYACQ